MRHPRLVLLLAALLLLAIALLLRMPRQALPLVGSAEQSDSIVGVHTRLTDEVEEWKIERTLVMAREMGAKWVVELFPWAYIEPRPGAFDWEHSDIVIRHANEQGLTVVARLDFVPYWARPANSSPHYLDRSHFEDYARFVGAFASRYRGAVRYYQIWNEPNTSLEWGYRKVDPADYVELMRLGYQAVKAADPDAIVVGGSLAPTLERDEQVALDDLIYLQRLYDLGGRPWFDVLGVHAYGFRLPPDDPPAPDRLNFRRTELLREIMVRNGDAGKPILITEAGWNDHPRWTHAVRPGQRIAYTLRAYEIAATEWPDVLGLCMWLFRLPAAAHNYNDYFAFVDPLFRPKPIYESVKREHPKWTRGSAWGVYRPRTDRARWNPLRVLTSTGTRTAA